MPYNPSVLTTMSVLSFFCLPSIFQPHGRAWKVVDRKSFMSIIPKYFALKKFHSFIRQLSGWGFKRLQQKGADRGCYYHECFLRGLPLLTWLMRRDRADQDKPVLCTEVEPNLYEISRLHPLPGASYDSSLSTDVDVAARSPVATSVKAPALPRAAPTDLSAAPAAALKVYPTTPIFEISSNEQSDIHLHTVSRTPVARDFFSANSATGIRRTSLSMLPPPFTLCGFINENTQIPSDQVPSQHGAMCTAMGYEPRENHQQSPHRIKNETVPRNSIYVETSHNPHMPLEKRSSTSSSTNTAAAAAAASLSHLNFQVLYEMQNKSVSRLLMDDTSFDQSSPTSFHVSRVANSPNQSKRPEERYPVDNFSTFQLCQTCNTEDSQTL